MEEASIQVMDVSSFQQLMNASVRDISMDTVYSCSKSRIINVSSAVIITCHKDLSILVRPEPIQIN